MIALLGVAAVLAVIAVLAACVEDRRGVDLDTPLDWPEPEERSWDR